MGNLFSSDVTYKNFIQQTIKMILKVIYIHRMISIMRRLLLELMERMDRKKFERIYKALVEEKEKRKDAEILIKFKRRIISFGYSAYQNIRRHFGDFIK